ncbi:MAG: hypothetical protein WC455_18275 [Dehalococcoidia bacterium]|jgi:hypothetical protein
MPKRNSIRVHKSDDLQGEDSWVKVKSAEWGKSKALRTAIKELDDDDATKLTEQLILEHFVGWNWVDDDGNPLPSLKEHPELFDTFLSNDEVTFLAEAVGGGKEKKGNSST